MSNTLVCSIELSKTAGITVTVKKAQGNGAAEKMDAKLMTGRFFMERMLPETGAHLARISSGADAVMALPAEMF